jgi:hypothetical protein
MATTITIVNAIGDQRAFNDNNDNNTNGNGNDNNDDTGGYNDNNYQNYLKKSRITKCNNDNGKDRNSSSNDSRDRNSTSKSESNRKNKNSEERASSPLAKFDVSSNAIQNRLCALPHSCRKQNHKWDLQVSQL